MLVLTRKTDEKIRIGADIEIVVRKICQKRVTLALSAPKGVPILREEAKLREVKRAG